MIKITIDTDNAAFEGDLYGTEIARILREAADESETLSAGDVGTTTLRDINGNRVGALCVMNE